VFKTWLGERDTSWRDCVEVAAMDGFTGFKTATSEELPDAVAVMDPFHVVRMAGDALDQCRRRVQQATCGHRGRKGDPLYAARRTLHTGSDLLTDKQRQRLTALFADDEHVEVEATWGIYQHMIAAYREPDRKRGRELTQQLIGSVGHSVPTALREVVTLGRTLKRRAVDVLAYFDRPGTSTGRPRRLTAASNISAAQPSASATSPTTSPDRFWRPAGSGPNYTLDHEEPAIMRVLRAIAAVTAIPATILLGASAASATTIYGGSVHHAGHCYAAGGFAICTASGTATEPRTIHLHVKAEPNQHVSGAWESVCTRGTGVGSRSGSFSGTTPLRHTIRYPFTRSYSAAGGRCRRP
jgi:hypothetical protein